MTGKNTQHRENQFFIFDNGAFFKLRHEVVDGVRRSDLKRTDSMHARVTHAVYTTTKARK